VRIRKNLKPQSRHHVHIFDEDWDFLMAHFGRDSPRGVTISEVIRQLVHIAVGRMKARSDEVEEMLKVRAGANLQTQDAE
jgi:hypothetical protein